MIKGKKIIKFSQEKRFVEDRRQKKFFYKIFIKKIKPKNIDL